MSSAYLNKLSEMLLIIGTTTSTCRELPIQIEPIKTVLPGNQKRQISIFSTWLSSHFLNLLASYLIILTADAMNAVLCFLSAAILEYFSDPSFQPPIASITLRWWLLDLSFVNLLYQSNFNIKYCKKKLKILAIHYIDFST